MRFFWLVRYTYDTKRGTLRHLSPFLLCVGMIANDYYMDRVKFGVCKGVCMEKGFILQTAIDMVCDDVVGKGV